MTDDRGSGPDSLQPLNYIAGPTTQRAAAGPDASEKSKWQSSLKDYRVALSTYFHNIEV